MSAFGDAFTRAFEARDLERERLSREEKDEKLRREILLESRAYNEKMRNESRAFDRSVLDANRLYNKQELKRIKDEAETELTQLVSSRPEYANYPIDFNGDWRNQTAKIDAFNAFRLSQGKAGAPVSQPETEAHDLSADSFNPETGQMKSEPLIIPTVTPEMEGSIAEHLRKKAIAERAEALKEADDYNQKKIGEEARREFGALTPQQKSVFNSLFGSDPNTNTGDLKYKIAAAKDTAWKLLNSQDHIDQTNTIYYNSVAKHIPSGAMVTDPATGRPTPFRARYNIDTGTYDRRDIDVIKSYLKEEEGQGSFRDVGKIWKWTAPPAPPAGAALLDKKTTIGGGPAIGVGAAGIGVGPTGFGVGFGVGIPVDKEFRGIPNPEPLSPLDDGSVREFWSKRGVSEPTYQAAKDIFDAIPEVKVKEEGGRYYRKPAVGFGDKPGDQPKGMNRVPGLGSWGTRELVGGIGDVNPSYESLFTAAMGRQGKMDDLIKIRINENRAKIKPLIERLPGLSAKDAKDMQLRIKILESSVASDEEKSRRLQILRESLIMSTDK